MDKHCSNSAAIPAKRGGPKTAEGKKRSSLNALKHGLWSKSRHAFEAIREIEERLGVDYELMLGSVRDHYEPADEIEEAVCRRLARCIVRLNHLEAMERRILERSYDRMKPGASFESVLKSERMVSLEMSRCVRTIAKKRQAESKKNRENEPISRST